MRLHTSIGTALGTGALIAGLAFATIAAAQSSGGAPRAPGEGPTTRSGTTNPNGAAPSFEALDKNHDGYISRMEAAEGGLTRSFTELDKNNDGRLDPAEFAAQTERPSRVSSAPNPAAPAEPSRR
jgi:EF hand